MFKKSSNNGKKQRIEKPTGKEGAISAEEKKETEDLANKRKVLDNVLEAAEQHHKHTPY